VLDSYILNFNTTRIVQLLTARKEKDTQGLHRCRLLEVDKGECVAGVEVLLTAAGLQQGLALQTVLLLQSVVFQRCVYAMCHSGEVVQGDGKCQRDVGKVNNHIAC
jgi:hypothetical protein